MLEAREAERRILMLEAREAERYIWEGANVMGYVLRIM